MYTGFNDMNGNPLHAGDKVKLINFPQGISYIVKEKQFGKFVGKDLEHFNLWCMCVEEHRDFQPIHYYTNMIVKVN